MEHEKIVDTLHSEIKPLSKETADALIDAFKNFYKSMEMLQDVFEKFNEVVNKELARQCVYKFFLYAEKYANATFITRWYWKRKAIGVAKTVKDVSDFLNNYQNHGSTDDELDL